MSLASWGGGEDAALWILGRTKAWGPDGFHHPIKLTTLHLGQIAAQQTHQATSFAMGGRRPSVERGGFSSFELTLKRILRGFDRTRSRRGSSVGGHSASQEMKPEVRPCGLRRSGSAIECGAPPAAGPATAGLDEARGHRNRCDGHQGGYDRKAGDAINEAVHWMRTSPTPCPSPHAG